MHRFAGRILIALTIWASLAFQQASSLSVSDGWRNVSAHAAELVLNEDYKGATAEYIKALRLAREEGVDPDIRVDLILDLIDLKYRAKDWHTVPSLLEAVREQLESEHHNRPEDLVYIRYLRRLRDLHSAEGKPAFPESHEIASRLGKIFGTHSCVYLKEYGGSILDLEWQGQFIQATECLKPLLTPEMEKNSVLAVELESVKKLVLRTALAMLPTLLGRPTPPEEIASAIELIGTLGGGSDDFFIDNWGKVLALTVHSNPSLARKAALNVVERRARALQKDASVSTVQHVFDAIEFLTLPTLEDLKPHPDADTFKLLDDSFKILQLHPAVTSAESRAELLSAYAASLAWRGKLRESEATMDQLQISQVIGAASEYGLGPYWLARKRFIAVKFSERHDRAGVNRQFDWLEKLTCQLHIDERSKQSQLANIEENRRILLNGCK